MERQEKISEQIEMAKRVGRNNRWVAIITESKLSKNSKRTWLGFRLEKEEDAIIGRIIEHDDGSVSEIIAIA